MAVNRLITKEGLLTLLCSFNHCGIRFSRTEVVCAQHSTVNGFYLDANIHTHEAVRRSKHPVSSLTQKPPIASRAADDATGHRIVAPFAERTPADVPRLTASYMTGELVDQCREAVQG